MNKALNDHDQDEIAANSFLHRRLVALGWTPPPVLEPRKIRVVLYGSILSHTPQLGYSWASIDPAGFLERSNKPPTGSIVVDIAEGQFDTQWPKRR